MLRLFPLTLVLLSVGVGGLGAQVVDTAGLAMDTVPVVVDRPAQDPRPVTPRGAFIRSLVIPGWGQAMFDANVRGGVYFSGWAGNWFMNFKNHVRLKEARNRLDLRTEQIRDSLISSPPGPDLPPNPDSMRAVLDTTNLLQTTVRADGVGSNLQALVSSRRQQREDWIAWSLFWLLAGGIDAYVTAHLADFPAVIDVEPHTDGSVSLRVDVPLPRRRR
jgi:hypothetical protein